MSESAAASPRREVGRQGHRRFDRPDGALQCPNDPAALWVLPRPYEQPDTRTLSTAEQEVDLRREIGFGPADSDAAHDADDNRLAPGHVNDSPHRIAIPEVSPGTFVTEHDRRGRPVDVCGLQPASLQQRQSHHASIPGRHPMWAHRVVIQVAHVASRNLQAVARRPPREWGRSDQLPRRPLLRVSRRVG